MLRKHWLPHSNAFCKICLRAGAFPTCVIALGCTQRSIPLHQHGAIFLQRNEIVMRRECKRNIEVATTLAWPASYQRNILR